VIFVLFPSVLSFILVYDMDWKYILVVVLLLQMNNGFGYLFGKLFGKTKIIKISPNKTLEGYFFSFIGILLGVILLHTFIPILKYKTVFQTFILICFIFIFGNIGDLLFSAIKRSIGVKDFSSILPGQGGILDHVDSDFFVMPLFYAFILPLLN